MIALLNKNCYKAPRFYCSVVAVLLTLFAAISFKFISTNVEVVSVYNNVNLIISIVTLVVFGCLYAFKITAKIGVIATWVLCFVNMLLYINTIYMYFAGVFYNGVTVDAFKAMDRGVIISLLCFFVACIGSNVAIYLKGEKGE